jgi:hypothetical protein
MPPELQMQPDRATIRLYLEKLTERWHELPEPAWLEMRALAPDMTPLVCRFCLDMLDEAVDFAANCNASRGIYAMANPTRETAPASGARDADVIGSCLAWIDCDDPASADAARHFAGPRRSMVVLTGRQPHDRPHVYWQLSEWVTDMAAHRDLLVRMAAHFGSDPRVVNPSRILRVPGTINHPAQHKRALGYVTEMVELRVADTAERVPFERMSRVFPAIAPRPASPATTSPSGIYIDTGGGPEAMDRAAAVQAALSGTEWHNNVIRVVASYVAKGLSDDEIHALTDPLTLPGYATEQTRREVQTAINGARAKGFAPAQEVVRSFDHPPAGTEAPGQDAGAGAAQETAQDAPPAWKIQTAAEFVADFVAPEYLIDGVVQRGRLYTLTGPTGTGKTGVMLYAATAIATGSQFCGLDTEPGDVLFLAGENPDDVRARVIATLEANRIEAAGLRLHFVAGTFSIRQDMAKLRRAAAGLPNLVMVVVDTLAAYFDGDDDNSNAQILDFARVVRTLTTWPGKPTVIMPSHPVKDVRKTNLVPRGGGALLNEVDGNLSLWKEDDAVTLHWQGKHRGPDFDPLTLELERWESPALHDRHGRLMPTVIAKPVLSVRAMDLAKRALTIETRILQSINDAPGLADLERAVRLGVPKATMQRRMSEMTRRKWLRPNGRKRALTEQGAEALKDGLGGVMGAGNDA